MNQDFLKTAARNRLVNFCEIVDQSYIANWHHEILCNSLQKGYERMRKGEPVRIIVEMPPQHGKLVAHDTPVLTQTGWKTHGELCVGDFVFGRDGKPKKVESISEEANADYIIRFADGSKFYVHGNHEWIVQDRRSGNREKTVETKWLAKEDMSVEGVKGTRGHRYRFYVDANRLVQFPDKLLPIHPYMLGVWLGDGDSSGGRICGDKRDLVVFNKLATIGYNPSSESVHATTGVLYHYFSNLRPLLRKLDVFQNKHIPDAYKYSALNQRLELLAGLIDTDGSRDKKSRYVFSTCNRRLAEDVRELVISLGSKICISEAEPTISSSGIVGRQIVYQVGFNLKHDLPVALKRKENQRKNFVVRRRAIIGVEKAIVPKVGRCIQVEGGIYLIGRTLIPTHNSRTATTLFPAWALGKDPSTPVIVSSHTADLAYKFGQDTRDVMNTQNYQTIFNTRLRPDMKAKGNWMTGAGGAYYAAGVGGPITGRGGRILIIDDPYKNREEANSETVRESVWRWYLSTFYTRQRGASMLVVIMTRWHLDDLVGRIEEQEKKAIAENVPHDEWEFITFPAIAEEDEKYRAKGDPLWPERFPKSQLEVTKRELGMYEWSALFQQHPVASEHQEFHKDWFRYYEPSMLTGRNLEFYTTVDPAISKNEEAGNSAVLTVAKERSGSAWFRVLETAGKMNPLELIDAIFYHYKKFRSRVYLETIAYQKSLKFFIIEEQRKRNVYFLVNELKRNMRMSKAERVRGLIPLYGAGIIHHLKGQDEAYERELLEFPHGAKDDRVDVMASMLEAVHNTQYEDEIEVPMKEPILDPYRL